ncbi:DUF4198 domain-containing protein [Candidatus Albibeggiatoa sp. nov. NOAA]|uniref:DUF4198 domain-containing protein n=1 Tax=Candidatus Albibeggiatoa sp. nov. NOAA TaxID=3162724 RepID=UPI0032FE245F|nr:DUF4198 domain-containing protein [Thiotrichaceae bacterium]
MLHSIRAFIFISLFSYLSFVQAHPLWVLPNEFSVSSEGAAWITVDVTASNVLFNYDHSFNLDNVLIHSPDGNKKPIDYYFKGHLRSVFDLQLTQNGTYKIEMKRPPLFFTTYKTEGNSRPQRLLADKEKAKAQLPADAQEVKTLLIHMESSTYVTNNGLSEQVLQPTGKGLELQAITHPNDIVRGEPVEFQLLVNGQPTADIDVELTPSGTQYRNERGALKFKTDAEGKFSFTPEQAGAWLMLAGVNQPSDTPLADMKRLMLYMTLEVVLD